MSDFQDRGPVHQAVFRWDGNHGRQGTGMNAVAHSCEPERAEELGRELGPLLWVSGAAAARPSVVRTVSRDGDVLLVQRWPTTDRGGRPSTVSHVLIGDRGTLRVRECLGLAYPGWRKQERAEQASGRLPEIDSARLDDLAHKRLPEMLERLPEVAHALILTTAELLRDPTQRVSLLLEEETPRDWPDRDAVPLVYLGLFLLFGRWLGQEWTFATCDSVDTHALRLMAVPRWEPDTGGSGPLARVMGRPHGKPRFEHKAATRLVDYLLAHREAAPGVPQLVGELPDGATLDWERRRDRLWRILGEEREQDRDREARRTRDREPERPTTPAAARAIVAPEPYGEPYASPALATSPPAPPPAPVTPLPPPAPVTPPQPFQPPHTHGSPNGHDPHALHVLRRDLREYRRGDGSRRSILMADLRTRPDEVLLGELRSAELPRDSVELLLNELGRPDRVEVRHLDVRHELCAEVLHRNLYFTPQTANGEHPSRKAMTDLSADLFTWAVAPLARDERYLRDLRELLYRMSRDPHPTTGNWLRQSIIEPANGRVPDLPPVLWSQLLRDAMTRNEGPPPAPALPRPMTVPPAPQAIPAPAQPAAFTPEPLTAMARISDLMNNPGCFIGSSLVVIAVLLGVALMLFV
ncbi:hypothetical protein OG331_16830 [Streptomyces sp. NBC_01017]|uniref:hypothetical protein n=1 Tax=Streptomyces sp. NBC_01017 TaxID=2903721 RepID=UPI003869122B|nr:hypothetical protein OG331_16830 [Streptomyces sp. NBC_01017]